MADAGETRRRYELKAVLGEGGFGTVYLARDLSSGALGSWVALKRLRPEAATVDEARFLNEAQVMAKLDNPAFVKVRALVKIDGRWSIEMDYVKGLTFGQLIKDLPTIPPLVALEIVRQVAQALHVAYESPGEHGAPLHVLHRDIKPSNLILQRWGVVRVLDFGIARFEGADFTHNTGTHLPGSGGYLAPERWGLIADFGHAADVFAVGVVLFELITQERFLDMRRLDMVEQPDDQVFSELLERRLAALAAVEGVHESVVALVRSTLACEARDRPTAGELERLCDQLISQLGGRDVWRAWVSGVLHPMLDAQREPTETDGLCGRRWSSDAFLAVTSTGFEPESAPAPAAPRQEEAPAAPVAWLRWALVLLVNLALFGGLFALLRDADQDGSVGVLGIGDCDDGDPMSAPGLPEICDRKDNDCDGQVDEGLPQPCR